MENLIPKAEKGRKRTSMRTMNIESGSLLPEAFTSTADILIRYSVIRFSTSTQIAEKLHTKSLSHGA
jgi:hypothetical protein